MMHACVCFAARAWMLRLLFILQHAGTFLIPHRTVVPVSRDLHQVLDEVFQEEICQEYWISASLVQRWPS